MPRRIYTTVSDAVFKELERHHKEKGHRSVQDVVRDIIADWYEERRQKAELDSGLEEGGVTKGMHSTEEDWVVQMNEMKERGY